MIWFLVIPCMTAAVIFALFPLLLAGGKDGAPAGAAEGGGGESAAFRAAVERDLHVLTTCPGTITDIAAADEQRRRSS